MTRSETLLEVNALLAGHAGPIVGPVSFALARGEVLGLAGPNGAGKSTLLAALTDNTRRFGGAVRLAPGLRLAHHDQAGAGFDCLPVSARDLFKLTAASVAGMPDWLPTLLDTRLDRLSGGQRQFLRLWAVLTAPADLILLDEPGNHLDQPAQDFLAGWLSRPPSDRAILLVAHDTRLLGTCSQVIEVGR